MGLTGVSNVLETRAVAAVDADGGETGGGNLLDILRNIVGGLAVTSLSVWGVGDGPLVTSVSESAGVRGAGWLAWDWGWGSALGGDGSGRSRCLGGWLRSLG